MTIRKLIPLIFSLVLIPSIFAGGGLGVQVGTFSPNKGLKDNDNGLAVGIDYTVKIALFGVKVEGFYVDSSGKYDLPGVEFEDVEIEVKHMLAADFMYYPAGMLFYLQAGINWINFDTGSVDGFEEELNNFTKDKLGYEVGAGITLFDKLKIQGKYMFTPDVVDKEAIEIIESLDDADVTGFLVTVGWKF